MGEWLEQGGEQSAVRAGERWPVIAELALQDGELVSQGEDLGVLVPVAHRQPPQQGEGVGRGQVGQSQQHD